MEEREQIHWHRIVLNDESDTMRGAVAWGTEIDGTPYQITRGLIEDGLFYASVWEGGEAKMLGDKGCLTLSDALALCGRDAFSGGPARQVAFTWDLEDDVTEQVFNHEQQARDYIEKELTTAGYSWTLSYNALAGIYIVRSSRLLDNIPGAPGFGQNGGHHDN